MCVHVCACLCYKSVFCFLNWLPCGEIKFIYISAQQPYIEHLDLAMQTLMFAHLLSMTVIWSPYTVKDIEPLKLFSGVTLNGCLNFPLYLTLND